MAQKQKKEFFNPFEADFANNMPNMDMFANWNKMREQMSRNVETITKINQVALDCAKESTRRAVEAMKKTAEHSYEVMKENASMNPEEMQSRQAEFVSSMVKSSFGNAKEVTEMASKAAAEIVDICNVRMQETVSEMSKSMNQANAANK